MFNIWHLYVPCQFLHHHGNPVFYLTNDLFIYLLFIWITNGLIVLKVMKCLTKVTVNLYLSIQLIIYFSEEDNSICMFKWGRECISLFTFLSWSTAKVGIKKCHENGKEKKNLLAFSCLCCHSAFCLFFCDKWDFFSSYFKGALQNIGLSFTISGRSAGYFAEKEFYSYVHCATSIKLL